MTWSVDEVRSRLNSQELDRARVERAAAMGDPACCAALGLAAPELPASPPPVDRRSILEADPAERWRHEATAWLDLATTEWDLAARAQLLVARHYEPQLRACAGAAGSARRELDALVDLLGRFEAWLRAPDFEALDELREALHHGARAALAYGVNYEEKAYPLAPLLAALAPFRSDAPWEEGWGEDDDEPVGPDFDESELEDPFPELERAAIDAVWAFEPRAVLIAMLREFAAQAAGGASALADLRAIRAAIVNELLSSGPATPLRDFLIAEAAEDDDAAREALIRAGDPAGAEALQGLLEELREVFDYDAFGLCCDGLEDLSPLVDVLVAAIERGERPAIAALLPFSAHPGLDAALLTPELRRLRESAEAGDRPLFDLAIKRLESR